MYGKQMVILLPQDKRYSKNYVNFFKLEICLKKKNKYYVVCIIKVKVVTNTWKKKETKNEKQIKTDNIFCIVCAEIITSSCH